MTDNHNCSTDLIDADLEEDDYGEPGMIVHDVAEPAPQALLAFTFDPWPRARSREIPVMISFGLADEKQKAAVVPRQTGSPWNGFGRNFRNHPCYELWTDGKLTGLASMSVTATTFDEDFDLRITAELDAIFLRTRLRGLGLCRAFCEAIADSLYRQILNFLITCPAEMRRTIDITVSAELYSEGGEAAITIICDDLCPRLEEIGDILGTPVDVEAITDAW
ncbi:hypothetical protein [Geopseudomonas aromaticivorans]